MPPFTLAPWELPPDSNAPLTAPANLVFRSLWQYGRALRPHETEIRLRTVPYKDGFLHFFCDGERPQNGNWVLSFDTHFPLSDYNGDFDTLEDQFRTNDDLWYESIMRLIFFDGTPYGVPGPHHATIAPGSYSCQLSAGNLTLGEEGCEITRLDLHFKNYRLPPRAVTIKNHLLAALKDPDSRPRQALSWLHLKPGERREQVQEFEQKKLNPMKAILTAVLQSQTSIWEAGLHLEWSTRELRRQDLARYRGKHWDGNDLYTTGEHIQYLDIPARMQRWKTLIWNTYIISPWEEWLLYADLLYRNEGAVGVVAPPPTADVRHEALLLLRDWLQHHYPSLSFEVQDADTPD